MPLSDTIKRIAKPGRAPIEIFIGGEGQSFQRDYQIMVGSPAAAENLNGVTPSAEIRTLDDNLLAVMTVSVTDAVNGWIRVTLTRAAADAIRWPVDGAVTGQRAIRGRWHVRLDDGTTSMPVMAGDVTVTR